MYIKVLIISLVVSVPVFILGAIIELGTPLESLSEPDFWLSHIYSLLSYSIVALLSIFLASLGSGGSSGLVSQKKYDSNKEQGQVKWFSSSKGYGFITRDQGDDVFVHYRSISGKGHRSLYEGQKVAFVVTDGEKGLQADEVEIL